MINKIKHYIQFLNFKKIIMIFLFGISFLSIWANPMPKRFLVQNIIVYGQSNIKDFYLKYDSQTLDNIKHSREYISKVSDSYENLFAFPVENFNTPIKQIKTDFKQMVNAEEYPNIYIKFDDKVCEQLIKGDFSQIMTILISIGGVERRVAVECNSEMISDSNQLYKGKAVIKLSDFELVPPNHIFGLFKLKKTILITFDVRVIS